MYYLCTRNSKERVFGGVWRALSGEQVLMDREMLGHSYYVIGVSAIWVLLYIIGVRRTSEALEKKNFSEYLVDSKSCCTFAFATQKKGVSERAR